MSHDRASWPALLSVRDLSVTFDTPAGPFQAVRGVSFEVAAGQTVAIVGESGSGKTTVAASINQLLADNGRVSAGQILFEGRDLVTTPERQLVRLRGAGIGLVPQDPMSNLDPVRTIGSQIQEGLAVHAGQSRRADRRRAIELLDMVGIPEAERRFHQYPHEFSGGMRQRVLIAMGLACQPRLLIADEPTSALDVTVQRRVLDLLADLTSQSGTAVIFITHDLALAAERAERLLVMFQGEIVEEGEAAQILHQPVHEYTRRLVAAVPSLITQPLVADPGGPAETLVSVHQAGHNYRWRGRDFWAARDISFEIPRGRTVSLVGESGSGKSTTAKMMLGLESLTEGTVLIGAHDIAAARGRDLLAIRRRMQPVFQNPFASLNPRYTIAESIAEPLQVHRVGDRRDRARRVGELLEQVALSADLARRYPHELSGGQRQRVAIARALALAPDLVVLDEAVSALDVLVQAQILHLLVELQQRLGLTYLFISHDLAVVNMISHQVHVMQGGRIVESGTTEQIFASPQVGYTRELLEAIPGRGHHPTVTD